MFERSELISKLKQDRKAREAYLRSKLNVLIPAQIRSLRLKHEMTQISLGQESEMKQARISAMESPGEVNFNLQTLVRLASAFRVGLVVKFVPFSELLQWENSFSQDSFDVVTLDQDGAFLDPASVCSIENGQIGGLLFTLDNAPASASAGLPMSEGMQGSTEPQQPAFAAAANGGF